MPLLPRFSQQIQQARKAAREAPGIDDFPKQEKPPPAGGDHIRLRGIPVIGSVGGEIPGTRPDRR